MKSRNLAALLAALALPLTACTTAQAPEYTATPVAQSVWPFAISDLPADPSYRVGVLDNGMRYIIRPNATPPEQGMVQLWVDFGSTAEGDEQQGWAHFIEHMAFNGSANVPEGEMVPLLERKGLAFGADTNASTSFDTTRYTLDLPRNDLDLLDTALMLMRETTSELTFDEEAVERERGIILSERSVRDTYQLRSAMDGFQFYYPGSRLSQRLPAGTVETINGATGAAMKQLWQKYYRPENVALIVVGDYEPDVVEAAIEARFGDWQGEPRIAPPLQGPVDFELAGQTDIFVDPSLTERITISRHGPWLGGPDTQASRRERLLRAIGYGIINRRFQRLVRQEDPPFRGAGVGTTDFAKEARTTNLIVAGLEGEWERGLTAVQQEYRRALAFGFSESEVAEQVANYRAAIEANAAGAETRSNNTFITGALTLLRDDQVPTTPQSALERFNAHAPLITPEAVMAALQEEIVPLNNPLIRFEGKAPPEGGEEALRAAWNAGMELPVEASQDAELTEFAYQDFGPAGIITSDTMSEALDIRTITFANGLKLNMKRTDLAENRISAQLNVDGGDMLNTRENPLATGLAGFLVTGGLGAHTYDELQSIMAGRNVSFGFGSGEETFVLNANTTPDDLELQLQLFAASLSDPGFRSSGEAQAKQNVRAYFASRTGTPASALSFAMGEIISGADPRFSFQTEEEYMALTFAKMREDIIDRLQNGALELALVGDLDEDKAIALVANTLGALPVRETDFRPYAENRDRAFTSDRSVRTVYHDGEDDQARLVMSWPTRDDSDHQDNLELELLERVVNVVLTDTLREELGQTYSPSTSASQSRVYPGYGTFSFSASIDTAKMDDAREAMLAALNGLLAAPVDEDILLRARQPLLESYDNALDTNGGWMNVADRLQTQPERLRRFLTGRDKLAAITPAQLHAQAVRYLKPDERLEIRVLPRPSE